MSEAKTPTETKTPITTRRAVLASGAAITAGGLAGCTSLTDDEDSSDGGNDGTYAPAPIPGGGGGGQMQFAIPHEQYAERFDEVINAVEVGADPNGNEPIDSILNAYARPGTLLVFPSGTYKMNSPYRGPRSGPLGIIGQNAIIRHGEVTSINGHSASGEYNGDVRLFNIGSMSNPFSGYLLFGGFIFDWSPENAGMQVMSGHVSGEAIVQNIQCYGVHSLGGHGNFRLSTQSPSSCMIWRNIDMRWGGLHYKHTINTRSTTGDGYEGRAGPSWSTSGMTIGSQQEGTMLIENVHTGQWPDNGIYAKGGYPSSTMGRKIIRGCHAANSNVSNIRTDSGDDWVPHPWIDGSRDEPAQGYDRTVVENCTVTVDHNRDDHQHQNQLGIRLDHGNPIVRNCTVRLVRPNGNAIRVQGGASGARIENTRVVLWEPASGIVMAGNGEVVNSVVNTVGFDSSSVVSGVSSGVNIQQLSPQEVHAVRQQRQQQAAQQQQQQQQQGGGGGGSVTGSAGGNQNQNREQAPVAAVRHGWGEPVASMSSNFRNGDLEGIWASWGDGEGCTEVSTWNGRRCGRNSQVQNGMHRIEGRPDGTSGGATSTDTFRYGRIEIRERARVIGNPDGESYNAVPLIYPRNPENQRAGNGEIDFAERRVGETPFFVAHWNGEDYYVNVDGLDGTQFHNYAVEWTPDHVAWFVDGHHVHTFNISIDIEAEMNAGQLDMFPPDGTDMQHNVYEIDWIRFHRWDASGPSPVPQTDHPGGTDWAPTGDNVRAGTGWQGD